MKYRKVFMLVLAAVYFLTPYSVKRMTVPCECGCRELICLCCGNPENFGDVTSFSECRCDVSDESYTQSPVMSLAAFDAAMTFYEVGPVLSFIGGSALPGYKEPPMKPPPTIQKRPAYCFVECWYCIVIHGHKTSGA